MGREIFIYYMFNYYNFTNSNTIFMGLCDRDSL